MYTTSSHEEQLLSLLRKRLDDLRYIRRAFTLHCTDSGFTDACVEIVNGRLRTTVMNAVQAQNLNIALGDFGVDSLQGLVDFINTQPGYQAVQETQMDERHPSIDLRSEGVGDLGLGGGVTFLHRRWSDGQLMDFLAQGARRHNLNYTPATVPPDEHEFVVSASYVLALEVLSLNSAKRFGLEGTQTSFASLSKQVDERYIADRRRQDRAVPVAEIRNDDIGEGNVVTGSFYRRSARTGFGSPISANLPPERPVLLEPPDSDVWDTAVRLSWKRIRDDRFYSVELWRDTQENVQRTNTLVTNPRVDPTRTNTPTTAQIIFQSIGANSNFDTRTAHTFIEEFGQEISSFIDGSDPEQHQSGRRFSGPPPEPETTYYYRLYVQDLNYEFTPGNVIRVTTKSMRARFDRNASGEPIPIVPTIGPVAGGTPVVLSGVFFHQGMEVTLGGKPVDNLVVLDAENATFDSPAVFNPQASNFLHDLSVRSLDGQIDVSRQVWRYTAT